MTLPAGVHRMGEREFVLFMALVAAMSALAIDILLPAFAQMRPAFGLDDDSTRLSLTVTLFLMGTGVGNLFYGPVSDAVGRKPTLAGSMMLYAVAALTAALAPSLGVLYVSRFVWGFAAGGSRTLTQAIVRDRFAGTAMARMMTLIQTAFFLAPILAPLLGKALVEIGSWRWVLAFGTVNAVAVLAWSLRLAETLNPANRRPLRVRPVLAGFRLVTQNRVSLGYALRTCAGRRLTANRTVENAGDIGTASHLLALPLMVTFGFGAFLSFLGSTELIFSDVYGRSGWFVPYFSAFSVVAAAVALGSNRILHRIEARQLALRAGMAYAAASAALFAVTAAGEGLPPFGAWLALFSLANACYVGVFPSGMSLALEPMGQMAGTAAAVLGFMGSVGGSLLASFTDRAIDGSVMPIGVAYLAYSLIALACQLWARGGASP